MSIYRIDNSDTGAVFSDAFNDGTVLDIHTWGNGAFCTRGEAIELIAALRIWVDTGSDRA